MSEEIDDIIAEEVESISSLEAELIDVTTALEQIQAECGVSKQLALSVEHYLPEDLPIASYTRTPTRTNYDVTVASLEDRKNAIIGAIVLALVAIIGKLIEWLFNRKSRQEMEKAAETIRNIKAESEELDKTAKSTKNSGNVSGDEETFDYDDSRRKADKEIKLLADDYNKRLEEFWNYFVESNFTKLQSKYKSMFGAQEDILVDYVDNIVGAMDYYKDLVTRDHENPISASSEFDSLTGLLSDKAQYIKGKLSGFSDVSPTMSNKVFLQDVMRAVKVDVDQEQAQPGRELRRQDAIDHLTTLVTHSDIGAHFEGQVRDPFFWRDDRMVQRRLKGLKKSAEGLKRYTEVQSDIVQVANMAKDSLKILRREVWGVMTFVKVLETLTDNQEKCFNLLLEYSKKRYAIEKKYLTVK